MQNYINTQLNSILESDLQNTLKDENKILR